MSPPVLRKVVVALVLAGTAALVTVVPSPLRSTPAALGRLAADMEAEVLGTGAPPWALAERIRIAVLYGR